MVLQRIKRKKLPYTAYSSYARDGMRKFDHGKTSGIGEGGISMKFKGLSKLLFVLLLICAVAFLTYYVFFSDTMVVKETGLFEDEVRVDNDIILSEINVYKGSPLLGVNKGELITELIAKYPEIEYIKVKKKLPDKLYF